MYRFPPKARGNDVNFMTGVGNQIRRLTAHSCRCGQASKFIRLTYSDKKVEMKIKYVFLILCLLSILCGCGKPVPAEKSTYVGEWQNKTMYLLITQEGSVSYRRLKDRVTTTITNAPLQGFVGNNFDVGIGSVKTTFVVEKPPFHDGTEWKMIVDGVELTKSK